MGQQGCLGGRHAADNMHGDPTAWHEIETLAREVGASARTLSRLFASETQLGFKSWCRRAHRGDDRKAVNGGRCLGRAIWTVIARHRVSPAASPTARHDSFLAGHDVFCATCALDCDRLRLKSM
jgi:hypothetical protein